MNVLFTLIVKSKQLAKIEFLIENGMKVYIEFTRTDWEDFTGGINLIWRTFTGSTQLTSETCRQELSFKILLTIVFNSDGVIIRDHSIYIFRKLQHRLTEGLHRGDFGTTKMIALSRQYMSWPTSDEDFT